MEGRVNYFGLSEDKLYYDERKKRFVNTKNMPAAMEREMRMTAFKQVPTTLPATNLCILATSRFVWCTTNRVRDEA